MTDVASPLAGAAEFMPYSVVRLIAVHQNNALSTGTGFFYEHHLEGGRMIVLLMTNKHVLRDAAEVVFDMHVSVGEGAGRRDSGEVERFRMPINNQTVIDHPDPNVDLCGIAVSGVVMQMNDAGRVPFYAAAAAHDIPSEEQWRQFSSIETVTMVGFPNGLGDEVNRMPLVRQGITATALHRDYNGRPDFMVDMACFPGSSGSPIYVWNPMYTFNRLTNQTMFGRGSFYLVGILFQGPLIDNRGQIVMAQPGNVSVTTMMHLGQAIKSAAIQAVVTAALARA